MYFVSLAGRNYNIAVSVRAGAPAGRSAAFTSRLESCNGPIFPIDCDVDINYHYEDVAANSGDRTITLLSGSSQVSEQPTGEILTVLYVNSLTGYGCTAYNQVFDCPGVFPTTTTTTTTTTSTTTTTTTVAAASYPAPIIKYDQYSSSFGPGGNPIWPNIGSGGSTYDMSPGTNSTISALGSGIGQYLRLKGGVVLSGPAGEVVSFINPALIGNFVSLYNISFSYAIVFRLQTPDIGSYNYISSINASNGRYIPAQFYIYNYLFDGVANMPRITSGIAQYDGDGSSINASISTTSKWYLGVCTFDKDGTTSNCLKFYINNIKIDGSALSFSPSSFFNDVQNLAAGHALSWGLNEVDVASVIFWQNTVLTQAQVQNLYNEYNSRYTLG